MQTDPFIGRKIDDFTVQERIGIGGMATVYRAYQPSVNRSVALKLIRLDPNAGETPEFARRFEQEAKVIASLENLHILPIYDYGIMNNEIAYFAMRLLRGGSLGNILADGAMNVDRACDIFTQIARGLSYAHSRGVIHRDLKPSNILMDEGGNAYLTDFGLAKMMEDSQHLTKTGTIVGTPVYMSPEQLRGEAQVDQRSDIYSMGVILYHMLVGRPPFDSSQSNMISIIYQHLERIPVSPREHNPAVSPEVEAVVMKALQKNPADRFQTAEEMSHAFNYALGRRISTGSYPMVQPHTHTTQPTITLNTQQKKRRSTWTVGAAAAVLIGVMVAVMVAVNQNSSGTVGAIATVLPDERGIAADVVPSTDEIARAQARLNGSFVAYLACNQSSEYHATQAREMGDFAQRYGLDYEIYDADSDPYSQLTQFERARGDGAGALILCPLDAALLTEALTSAQTAGIPLVSLHSDMPGYGGILLGGDEYLMGLEAGRAAGVIIRDEMGGRANVVILDYPSMPVLVTRANGLQDGVLELAPNATIIGRYEGATRENGERSIGELIEQETVFDVIVSINDAGSYGAIAAMESADFDPASVVVSSVDAEALARQYIRDDYFMRASVDAGRVQFSTAAVDGIVRLLGGATLPELILVPPGQAITRDMLSSMTPVGE